MNEMLDLTKFTTEQLSLIHIFCHRHAPLPARVGVIGISSFQRVVSYGAARFLIPRGRQESESFGGIAHDKIGKKLFSCTVIPNRGAWLEYETDSNDVFYVRVDRTRKVPITVFIRALGVGTNEEILELFGDEPKIHASFTKDTAENYQEGLKELYSKIRPGEPFSLDSAENLVTAMCFDPRRDVYKRQVEKNETR